MSMSPREIVNELDRYIVGQDEAKKAVAIALRNRYRRSRLTEEEREEITPKNIIMQGPTGVGKTELSKALAEAMFADENALIRIDMSEFMEKHSVSVRIKWSSRWMFTSPSARAMLPVASISSMEGRATPLG